MSPRHAIGGVHVRPVEAGKQQGFVAFRQGKFTIPEADYRLITRAMGLNT